MTEEEFLSRAWLAELSARPRTAADMAFWRAHRAEPGGGRDLIFTLSDRYLAELHRHTRFRRLKAALWLELRERRRNKWLGRHGRIARLLRLA